MPVDESIIVYDAGQDEYKPSDVTLEAAIAPPREAALGLLQATFAMRDDLPVTLVFAGSSTTEGVGASVAETRYVNRLAARLQAHYPLRTGTPTAVRTLAAATAALNTPAVGIQAVNAGAGGTNAATYLTTTTRQQIANLNPRAIFHMIGSNDFAQQRPVATYKSDVEANISALDAILPGPCVHVLLHAYERPDAAGFPIGWDQYGKTLREIAETSPGRVAFLDLSGPYYLAGVPKSNALGLITPDRVHQTDRGHGLTADQLFEHLTAPVPMSSVSTTFADVLLFDSFSRANSTTSLGSADSGQAWASVGAWGILSGKGYGVEAGVAYADVASTDNVEVYADVAVPSSGTAGIGVRANNAGTDRLTLYYSGTSLILAKIVSGALTTFATYSVSPTGTRRLGLRIVGNVLTAYMDGAVLGKHTLSASDATHFNNAAHTHIALRQGAGGSTVTSFDNLLVRRVV